MEKIEKLTETQEKQLADFYQEMLKIGRSCEPIVHSEAERIIAKLYELIGQKPPQFLYYQSPHQLLKEHPTVNLYQYFGGQYWVYWKAVYTFAEKYLGVTYDKENSDLLALWMEESKHLHWWFPFENYCLISERPIRLTVDDQGRLHNEKVKAIEYADGYGMYYLHGVKVPEYLVVTDAENLDIDFFTKETNADVKAEFVRKYGIERMLQFGVKVDSYEKYDQEEHPWWWKSEYELWDMKSLFVGLDYQPFLKMANQTTGIWHVEAVPPTCLTISDALKARFGGRDMKIVDIK
jgi:hypothetical protein